MNWQPLRLALWLEVNYQMHFNRMSRSEMVYHIIKARHELFEGAEDVHLRM